MPAITGQSAVDVAIGLFLGFFPLSVLCSATNESWMLADASATPARNSVRRVVPSHLSFGWSLDRADLSWSDDTKGFVAEALSLGAPLWFDLLGEVSQLRGAGRPPPTGAA